MSEYKPPSYSKPPNPSRQLQVVFQYFDCLKKWDFETLSQLSTPYFTQATLPASLKIPVRNKTEDIEFLHQFRDALKGAPLDLEIYDVNETKGKIWVHLIMKTVNNECFFLFTFGKDKDENLIINLTEFVDSKVFSGDGSTESEAQPETPVQTLSKSVGDCIKATRRCFVDTLLFLPRFIKYVVSKPEDKGAPGKSSM